MWRFWLVVDAEKRVPAFGDFLFRSGENLERVMKVGEYRREDQLHMCAGEGDGDGSLSDMDIEHLL